MKKSILVTVAVFALALVAGRSLISSATRLGLQGGAAQMYSDLPFQLVTVSEMPASMAERYRQNASHLMENPPPVNISPERPVSGRPLAEIENGVEPLLVPTHLPEGFSYARAFVSEGTLYPSDATRSLLTLTFIGSGSPVRHVLSIQLGDSPPRERWPVRVTVKEGFARLISTETVTGYFQRGMWGSIVDPLSDSIEVGWIEEAGLSLVFVRNDHRVVITSRPASAFTEEELLRVAESLQPYAPSE